MFTYGRIETMLNEKGITAYKMAKDLGFSTSKVTAWKQGKLPSIDALILIADYFQISLDELVGREFPLKKESDL